MLRIFILALSLVVFGGGSAHAFDQAAVTAFCAAPDRKIAAEGKQPDGKAAADAVMALKPGKYALADGGAIEVFEGGAFILDKPRNAITFRGTDGDDMMSPSSLAGCSLGQLSEALGRNNIAAPAASDMVK